MSRDAGRQAEGSNRGAEIQQFMQWLTQRQLRWQGYTVAEALFVRYEAHDKDCK